MRCLVRDVEFNYVERGEGIPLIALHGWPLDHRHMLEPLEPLFEARPGWRRIYPDLPGMGMTPGPAWLRSQAQMVDLVLELVDSLVPGRRFVVAGASYGGWLARAIAHEMGDRLDGIFLSVPAIFDSPKPEHVVRQHDPAFLAALGPGEESAADMVVSQSVDVVESWRRNVFPGLGLADQAFLDRVGAVSRAAVRRAVPAQPAAGPRAHPDGTVRQLVRLRVGIRAAPRVSFRDVRRARRSRPLAARREAGPLPGARVRLARPRRT